MTYEEILSRFKSLGWTGVEPTPLPDDLVIPENLPAINMVVHDGTGWFPIADCNKPDCVNRMLVLVDGTLYLATRKERPQAPVVLPMLASALGIDIMPRVPSKLGNGKVKQHDQAKKRVKRAAQAERCKAYHDRMKGV